MSEVLRIFCVDDDVMSDVILESVFADTCEVEFFTSAEGCLRRLETLLPDILLLNVNVADQEGFNLCRDLKARGDTAPIPVVFLARNDSPEVRLAAYEAGGEDFIVKPYVIDEVRYRINHLRQMLEQRESMRQQLEGSEQLSTLLLSNMDEYAALIQFMRTLNESQDVEAVAQAILGMLQQFHLQGAVQVRMPNHAFTVGDAGRDNPMDTSTIAHVAKLDRIFQFKRCCAYNFQHLTLLVNNMPVEDADLCGRLRDHLAIGVEMAEARVRAMIADQRFHLTHQGIGELLSDIQRAIHASLERNEEAHHEAVVQVRELMNQLVMSFTPLGMSNELEEEISAMVLEKTQKLVSVFEGADETSAILARLEQRLRVILEE